MGCFNDSLLSNQLISGNQGVHGLSKTQLSFDLCEGTKKVLLVVVVLNVDIAESEGVDVREAGTSEHKCR